MNETNNLDDINYNRFRSNLSEAKNSNLSYEQATDIVLRYGSLFANMPKEDKYVHKISLLPLSKDSIIKAYYVFYLHGIKEKHISEEMINNTFLLFSSLNTFVNDEDYKLVSTFQSLSHKHRYRKITKIKDDFPALYASFTKIIRDSHDIQEMETMLKFIDVMKMVRETANEA